MSGQNQVFVGTAGESARTPEPVTEKNEIPESVSADSAAPSVSDDTPAADGAAPVQSEVKTENVAETGTPVVESKDSATETAAPAIDQKETVSPDTGDNALAAEAKPENQAAESQAIAKQDEKQETTEQPETSVVESKDEIRETAVPSADQTETIPPVPEPETAAVSAQDKNQQAGELHEKPAIGSKEEVRDTATSGTAPAEPALTESADAMERTPAVDARDKTAEMEPVVDETGPTVATKQDANQETIQDKDDSDITGKPFIDTENEISGTDQLREEPGNPGEPVVDEKTALDPVSENENPVTDSGNESSESGQAKADAKDADSTGYTNDSGADVPASQADEPETGSDTQPEHTFKSSIILPEGVVGIIRVVKQGKYGEIVQREDGEWVYQLNGAINSGDEQGSNTVPEADYVYVIIEDTRGNKLRTKITVAIIDDVPELDVKGEETLESGAVHAGKLSYNYGADYIDYDDHDPKHLDVTSSVETKSVNDFVNPIVIRGQYGVLTIQPNGKYSYKANPLLHGQEGGTDTFTFSITDADGDTVTKNLDGTAAGLTFIVEKPAEPEPPVISEVCEKALLGGTEPGDPYSTVTIPDGYTLIVKEGGDHPGHLEQNPDGSWKYVLDKSIDSGDEQGQNTVNPGDTQTVILRDKEGNEWEFEVPVSIVDDAPVADDDYNEITKGQESVVSSGSVLDNDKYGADREADVDAFVWNTGELSTDENGRYVLEHGSIQLNSDGTYAYYLDNSDHDVITLTEGKSLCEEVTYQIKDADGDIDTATLTIEIKGKDNGITITPKDPDKDPDPVPDPDDPRDKTPDPDPDPTDPEQPDPDIPTEPRDPDVPVDPADPTSTAAVEQIKERELRSGESVRRHGDLEVSAPDGVTSILMNGEDLIDGELHTFDTEIGALTIRYDRESETGGRLKYEYVLKKAADHGKATTAFDNTDIVQEIFKFTVTDSDGTEASSRIIVRVIDDVPTAADDVATVEEGATDPITGNVLTGDAEGNGKDEFGADGKASENSLVWNGLLVDGEITATESEGVIQGQYGTFRPGEDGNWTYELDNTSAAVQALRGSYTDEDGNFHEAETLTEVVRYTIKDADGDESMATLTITITGKSGDPSITPTDPDPEIPGDPDKPVDPDDPKTQGALIVVHEKNLSDGTDPDTDALTVEGTMVIYAPDGVKSLYIGEQEIRLDGTATTINIGENVLTLSYSAASGIAGTLSYSFTLTDELSHKDGEALLNELLSKYQLTLTDLEDKTAKSALHVKVMDDNPEMTLDDDIELESGDEMAVDFSFIVGADNGDGKKLVVTFKKEDGSFVLDEEGTVLTVEIEDPNSAWKIKGQFGTLSRDDDGNYKYKADPFDEDALGETLDGDEYVLPTQVKDIFNFTLIDADGDATEPEDWTATIRKPGYDGSVEVPEALKRPLITWEADMVDGEAVYEITVPEGYEIPYISGDPQHGEVFEKDGKWYYKLTEPIDSGDIQGSNWVKNADSFIITVERTDDGAWFDMRVPVTIVDDVPVFDKDVQSEVKIEEYTLGFYTYCDGVEAGESELKFSISSDNMVFPCRKEDFPVVQDNATTIVVLRDSNGEMLLNHTYSNSVRDALYNELVSLLAELDTSNKFALSFGADGPAEIPFTIEDGIEPDSAENDTYTFEIKDHATLPAGQIIIQKTGDNWQYSFIPENGNLNYDFELKLNAIDADGDVASRTLHFNKSAAPELSEPESISVDEGDQPYHEDSHENSGQKSFTVNLHGDDGTINIGEIAIAIENGAAAPDKTTFTTESGIVIELGEIACDEDGIWTVNYNYSHNGEAQKHGESGWEGDSLSNDIAVTVTSANGKSISESISGHVHDDIPVFGKVAADEELNISDPWPIYRYQYNQGAIGLSLQDEQPEYNDERDEWTGENLLSNATSSGLIAINIGDGFSISLNGERRIIDGSTHEVRFSLDEHDGALTLTRISGCAWKYEITDWYVYPSGNIDLIFENQQEALKQISLPFINNGRENGPYPVPSLPYLKFNGEILVQCDSWDEINDEILLSGIKAHT